MDAYELPDDLFEYAMIPGPSDVVDRLASIAEPEDWEYQHTSSDKSKPILYNYLRYAYRKIAQEKKVAVTKDEQWSCWNTGLVTDHQEQIYLFFNKNRSERFPQYWHYAGFFREGEQQANKFDQLPDMAHYFDAPSKLVFDTHKEVRKNIKHIAADNRDRFPASFVGRDLYHLEIVIEGAFKNAIERVKRNYKTAIPQYYNGTIQLLLPLCLETTRRADLALVVEDFESFYRASTCLTLDMAYNNARQIARPDRDWLQP